MEFIPGQTLDLHPAILVFLAAGAFFLFLLRVFWPKNPNGQQAVLMPLLTNIQESQQDIMQKVQANQQENKQAITQANQQVKHEILATLDQRINNLSHEGTPGTSNNRVAFGLERHASSPLEDDPSRTPLRPTLDRPLSSPINSPADYPVELNPFASPTLPNHQSVPPVTCQQQTEGYSPSMGELLFL